MAETFITQYWREAWDPSAQLATSEKTSVQKVTNVAQRKLRDEVKTWNSFKEKYKDEFERLLNEAKGVKDQLQDDKNDNFTPLKYALTNPTPSNTRALQEVLARNGLEKFAGVITDKQGRFSRHDGDFWLEVLAGVQELIKSFQAPKKYVSKILPKLSNTPRLASLNLDIPLAQKQQTEVIKESLPQQYRLNSLQKFAGKEIPKDQEVKISQSNPSGNNFWCEFLDNNNVIITVLISKAELKKYFTLITPAPAAESVAPAPAPAVQSSSGDVSLDTKSKMWNTQLEEKDTNTTVLPTQILPSQPPSLNQ